MKASIQGDNTFISTVNQGGKQNYSTTTSNKSSMPQIESSNFKPN